MSKKDREPVTTSFSGNIGPIIKAYVERVERINETIAELNDDKKDIFAEAKGNGFDVKTLKTIVQIRRKDPDEMAEADAQLDMYMRAMEEAARMQAQGKDDGGGE